MRFLIFFLIASFSYCAYSIYMKGWGLFASIGGGFAMATIATIVIGCPILIVGKIVRIFKGKKDD